MLEGHVNWCPALCQDEEFSASETCRSVILVGLGSNQSDILSTGNTPVWHSINFCNSCWCGTLLYSIHQSSLSAQLLHRADTNLYDAGHWQAELWSINQSPVMLQSGFRITQDRLPYKKEKSHRKQQPKQNKKTPNQSRGEKKRVK